jgi:hypothetical protein
VRCGMTKVGVVEPSPVTGCNPSLLRTRFGTGGAGQQAERDRRQRDTAPVREALGNATRDRYSPVAEPSGRWSVV